MLDPLLISARTACILFETDWNINKNHLHNGNIRALFGKAEGWFTFSTTASIAQTFEWYVQKYFEQSFKRTSMSDSLIACELNWYGQTGCTLLCEMKGMKDGLKFYCTDESLLLKAKHSRPNESFKSSWILTFFSTPSWQGCNSFDRVGKLGLGQRKRFWPAT